MNCTMLADDSCLGHQTPGGYGYDRINPQTRYRFYFTNQCIRIQPIGKVLQV